MTFEVVIHENCRSAVNCLRFDSEDLGSNELELVEKL